MNVIRVNEFQAALNKEDELFKFLKSLILYISSSQGCISCELFRESENKTKFLVIEKWESVECHRKSLELFPKEEMRAAMSLFGASPKGSYYDVV